MQWVIGGVLGLIAFVSVIVLGSIRGVEFGWTLVRAAIALGVGALLGSLVFGPLGMMLAKESAGPERKPKKDEKPEEKESQAPPETT